MSAIKHHHHDTIEAAQRGKERPILFSADMVRAILDGRKTQTRRIIKSKQLNQNPYEWQWLGHSIEYEYFGFENKYFGASPNELHIKNSYGQPGNHLWVRETWAHEYGGGYLYRASHSHMLPGDNRWRPSIHMPRAASRITLEITDIRAECLRDITEEDAYDEGFEWIGHGDISPKYQFEKIWEKINGPGSWEKNPWVWVITFKKIG